MLKIVNQAVKALVAAPEKQYSEAETVPKIVNQAVKAITAAPVAPKKRTGEAEIVSKAVKALKATPKK